MARRNFPINVETLYEVCKAEIAKGNGKRFILVSDDEEGNGYHECYFGFENGEDILKPDYGVNYPYDLNPKECVTLG